MWNGRPKKTITRAWHDRKKRYWRLKLHYLALTNGGGSCTNCGDNRTCDLCKYAFEQFGEEKA